MPNAERDFINDGLERRFRWFGEKMCNVERAFI